jgi:hypothetical protein
MKKLLLLFSAFELLSFSAFSADLSFSNAPQTNDSASILMQREAVSLWNLEHGTITITGAGDASAANQTVVEANPGSDATKAIAVQGVTGGKALPVSGTFWQATQPVSNAGTFAVQSNLQTGTNVVGKVGIDQTTPGTTNAVQVTGGAADATNNIIATAQKKIAASTYSPSAFSNLGANATLNVKSSAGNVYSISCYNANAASRFIQLHNTATTPSSGAAPVYSFLVPAGGQIVIGTDFFTNEGVNFSTGIAFAFSTTMNTYTAGTAGDQSTFIQYK